MKSYKIEEIKRQLRKNGYERVRIVGSHGIWKDERGNTITVPETNLKPIIAHKILHFIDSNNEQ